MMSTVEFPCAESFLCILTLATPNSVEESLVLLGGSPLDETLTCPILAVIVKRDAEPLV